MIVGVACRNRFTQRITRLPQPYRHTDLIDIVCNEQANMGMPEERIGCHPVEYEQGFYVHGTWEFVTRQEAYVLAVKHKQLLDGVGRPPKLYSEDVW